VDFLTITARLNVIELVEISGNDAMGLPTVDILTKRALHHDEDPIGLHAHLVGDLDVDACSAVWHDGDALDDVTSVANKGVVARQTLAEKVVKVVHVAGIPEIPRTLHVSVFDGVFPHHLDAVLKPRNVDVAHGKEL